MSKQQQQQQAEGGPARGLAGARTTGVFRAVNFELFARPVSLLDSERERERESFVPPAQRKSVMALGALCMAGCVTYLLFLNLNAEGSRARHARSAGSNRTRWDS